MIGAKRRVHCCPRSRAGCHAGEHARVRSVNDGQRRAVVGARFGSLSLGNQRDSAYQGSLAKQGVFNNESEISGRVLVVAAGAILLAPIVSRASHPPRLSKLARLAQTAQAAPDASGSALYNFTTINAPGSSSTTAFGINNPGPASGFYVDADGRGHGFCGRMAS